jgi:hypothetical protein
MNPAIKCLAGATVLYLASAPTFAANAQKKYCLNAATGGSSCSFDTMEQCRETVQGRHGWCSEQVDFGSWAAGRPEDSFASYPRGQTKAKRKLTPDEQDLEDLRKNEMPAKGVGSE